MASSSQKFNPYKQTKKKELESGVFEKPHKIVVKTVVANGIPQEFPVKVYEPMKSVEPVCNPVSIMRWADGIMRKSRGSE